MPSPRKPLRVLILFPGDWDEHALAELEASRQVTIHREGFDVRRFPQCLRAIWFDPHRFLDRICRRYRGRIDAVWSNDEQLGCLLAAMVADRLGLPGTSPEVVVRAQHKLLMRQTLARELPSATVAAAALPLRLSDARLRDANAIDAAVTRAGLAWPLFCKPIKGTFSVLANRAGSASELAAQMRLTPTDRFTLGRLIRPFDALAASVTELPCASDCLLLEEPMRGQQVNVDGYAYNGAIHVLGVVDEWAYPRVAGGHHFMGFTYPTRLQREVRTRVIDVAVAAMRTIGFKHGQFNVELFVLDDGSVRVIEINPRAAAQFTTFYRDVDGRCPAQEGMWLAAGRDPADLPRQQPFARVAASIVWRRFDGRGIPKASPAGRQWLATNHPRARLWLDANNRSAVQRQYRWLRSYRYAVLNCSGRNFNELQSLGDDCGRRMFGAIAARPVIAGNCDVSLA